MKTSEIRQSFLDFFNSKDHEVVSSSSLVPNNDETLLFTNAGMVQFKDVFLGTEKRNFSRAVTSQRCIRAGGKHNDLENVGYTLRHHTFFEMLGNFSFGDYFKEDAIKYAWEFLTEVLKLDKDKLWITVYKDDDEAEEIWKNIIGVAPDRIARLGDDDNFWSMGDTGPCGPCSEIFFDHGEHIDGTPPGHDGDEGDRFVEIWNLVFMQFNRDENGKTSNLPKPSVDTGMGLERIAALLQGTHDNYQTDHFKKLISSISDATKVKQEDKNISSFRVIADHLRASSFLLAEGVLPSNEGRGYVLRRIMRRGMRHSHLLGSKEPIFFKIFEALKNEMSGNYPELERSESLIKETLKMEEEKFLVLLDRGIKILNDEISKIDKVLPGDVAFKLYDTYGFPLDLTEDILKNKSLTVDHKKFDQLMKNSKELAKKNWKGSGDSSEEAIWFSIKDKIGPTEFLGYESNQSEGVILNLIKENSEVKSLSTGEEGMIITNQTPFYGESGGQLGDKGTIVSGNSVFEVEDTQKKLGNLFVHYGSLKTGSIKVGEAVELKIDIERRANLKAYHSATHLLHESLRRTLGKHVMQKGSLVAPDRLRFDFSHMKPITDKELETIDKLVNEYVKNNTEVTTRIMTPKAAIEKGALAFFGEKYGEEVRVVSMGKEKEAYFSTELCGGTHVKNTGDIGKFKTVSQSSIAAGVRRVEALRDKQLEDFIKNKEKLSTLSTQKDEETIKDLSSQIIKLGGKPNVDNKDLKEIIKNLSKQLEQLNVNSVLQDKTKNIINDQKIKDIKVRFQKVIDLPPKDLRKLVDNGKKELGDGIIIVFATNEDKVGLAVGITEKLVDKYDAVKFAKLGSETIGGKGGGGRKDFAQAGGQDQNKIDEAFDKIKSLI